MGDHGFVLTEQEFASISCNPEEIPPKRTL